MTARPSGAFITGGLVAKCAIALVVLAASVAGITRVVSTNDGPRSSVGSPPVPVPVPVPAVTPSPFSPNASLRAAQSSSSPVASVRAPEFPASSPGGALAADRAAERAATIDRSPIATAPRSTSLPPPSAPRVVAAAASVATPNATVASDEAAKGNAAFSEELALLEHARRATSAGNHADALDALTRMDRLPGGGAFAEEHDALRIVALCSSGRTGDGHDALTRFRGQFPRSLHAERVARACGE